MFKNIAISVIIPAYNEEAYLGRCLSSLKSQLNALDEIIVVDNRSSDQTVAVAKSFTGVKVITEPVQGQVCAQRAGFDAAKNRILARIDADSIIAPGWVEELRKAFRNPDLLVTSGSGLSYDTALQFMQIRAMKYVTFTSNWLVSGHYPVWGSNFAFTRDTWLQVRDLMSYDTQIWEDFEMGIVLDKLNIDVVVNDRLLVHYSNRNGVNSRPIKAIKYQLRAPLTYWRYQSKIVGAISLVERLILITAFVPVYMVEYMLSDRNYFRILGARILGFGTGRP